MIDWFYSDHRIVDFVTGVTRAYQKMLEPTKTIVDTSNRPRVVPDVVCDDFMHSERPLSAKQAPSQLAAPWGASASIRVHGHGQPAATPLLWAQSRSRKILWSLRLKSATLESRLQVRD